MNRPLDCVGSFELMGRADFIMTYYYVPSNKTYKHVVDIVKARSYSPSRHGFKSLHEAHRFMQQQTIV